jgi:N-acetylmuramoyl-L-alanine amidase
LALQQRLFELGFDPGRVDGVIGGETERALREFQRSVGISADGTCGPITLQALARLSRTVTGGAPHALREAERMRRSGPGAAGKVIVIDPGHGGSEQGSVGLGLTEAVLVEDLAARVEGRLAAVGATAYLSRGRLAIDDEPADESTRADFANGAGADLLVSLHVDCDDNPRASGVAAYFYGAGSHGAHSVVGEMFADLVMRELVARTDLLDGRIHGKTWDLLRRTRMPAVRLEIGYLSNAHDAARLADPSFRDVIAEAIVVAMQRLWLPEGSDAATGTLHLPDFAGHRS